MKGPSGRIRYRISRHWQCPRCGHQLDTPGDVVVLPCPKCPPNDQGEQPAMSIVEPRRTRNPFPFGTRDEPSKPT